VRIAVIADEAGRDQAGQLVDALVSEGAEARLVASPAGADDAATAQIAAALLAFEGNLTADRPDAVAVVGEGEEALAAAIVAAKLEIPTFRAGGGDAGNGRVIGILATRTVAANPAQAAQEIAAGS
jgi:hypothetical protein